MIEIKKGKEPPELMAHRKTQFSTYENMPKETHQVVLECLMRDQGFICAYCMRRIPQKGKEPAATIEHWDAQSKTNNDQALDYRNMLAVCNGNRGEAECYMTCDAKRKNEPLTVNPLNPLTLHGIQYKTDGTIFADDPAIKKDLDKTLNLNCNRFGLVDSRRDALQRMIMELNRKFPTGDIRPYCSKLLKTYKEAPQKTSYQGILIWWLEKHC